MNLFHVKCIYRILLNELQAAFTTKNSIPYSLSNTHTILSVNIYSWFPSLLQSLNFFCFYFIFYCSMRYVHICFVLLNCIINASTFQEYFMPFQTWIKENENVRKNKYISFILFVMQIQTIVQLIIKFLYFLFYSFLQKHFIYSKFKSKIIVKRTCGINLKAYK